MSSIKTKVKTFAKFREFDKNGDGHVTFEDAQEVLGEEIGLSPEKSARLFDLCDKDKSGKLDYNEFTELYQRVNKKMNVLKAIFDQYDTNNDGTISPDEAHKALEEMPLTPEEIDGLMATYDENKDGRLQYMEFVRMWSDLFE